MTHTARQSLRTAGRFDRTLVRILIVALAAAALLAGCVLPDGTVYTLPEAAPAEQTVQTTVPLQDAEPSPAQPLLIEADAALAGFDYEAALDAFTQAIEADPGVPYAHYGQALSYANLGELEPALAAVEQAVALAPNNTANYSLRGELRAYAGDLSGAEEDYTRALDLSDGGALLEPQERIQQYYFRGQVRVSLGDLSGALDDLGQVLRINPLLTVLFRDYREMAASADLMTATIEEADRFARESESPGRISYAEGIKELTLAQVANNSERYVAAVDLFSDALEADPKLADAFRARGIARIGVAELPQLMGSVNVGPDYATYTDPETGEQVTVTREEWDNDWELHQEFADAARQQAIEDLRQAVALDPSSAQAIHDLGVALFAQQEALYGMVYAFPDAAGADEALGLFDRAAEMDPEWEQARLSRAIADQYWGAEYGRNILAGLTAPVADMVYAKDGSIAVLRSDTSTDRWRPEEDDLATNMTPLLEPYSFANDSLWLTPDGENLLTVTYEDSVEIRDLESGEQRIALQGHESGAFETVMSEDGALVAAAGREMLRVWDAQSGELLLETEGRTPIAFSPDGGQLGVAATDDSQDIVVIDVATGAPVATLAGAVPDAENGGRPMRFRPQAVAFSADGQTVAALSGFGALRVWDLASGGEARLFRETEDYYGHADLAFSPDSASIVITMGDGRLAVYDVESGEEMLLLGKAGEYSRGARTPVFSPDGAYIAAATADGQLQLWDAASGELIHSAQREENEELATLKRKATELLQQAIEDGNWLIDREAGDGWPYYVRASAAINLSELEGRDIDEERQAQLDADWQAFRRLSPDVRPDDAISVMPSVVRFSGPVAPSDPLMASRIEYTDERRMFVHELEGFEIEIPAQGPTGRVGAIYVPGGPVHLGIVDDFRHFYLILMDGDLGQLSAQEWLTEMLLEPQTVESLGTVETDLGEAEVFNLPDRGEVSAVLPLDDGRIFYLAYIPNSWPDTGAEAGFDAQGSFAAGYGLKLGPAEDVLTEFVQGLSLTE